MPSSLQIDESLIARVVAQVLRELQGGPVRPELPKYISDVQARRELYGNPERSTYWRMTKDPRFPPAVQAGGRSKLRLLDDHLAYIAARKVRPEARSRSLARARPAARRRAACWSTSAPAQPRKDLTMTETTTKQAPAPRIKARGRPVGFKPIPANERPCPVCGGPMLPGPRITHCSSECADADRHPERTAS